MAVVAATESVRTVPVTTLDAEATATALTGPVVAKIDVEGFEVEVLRGPGRFIAAP
jgi:FkbM family methyltransferase